MLFNLFWLFHRKCGCVADAFAGMSGPTSRRDPLLLPTGETGLHPYAMPP